MNDFFDGDEHGEKFGDKAFISEQIDLLPISMQIKVRARYGEIYAKLSTEDKDNCRSRSNTWLRSVVKKHGVKIDNSDDLF